MAAHDDDTPHVPGGMIEFPEALDVFFSRMDEMKRIVGPAHAAEVEKVGVTLREALAARGRGDLPGAMAAIMQAMERLAEVVSGAIPDEGPMMQAMAGAFQQAMVRGAVGEAKAAAEVMREKSGSTLIPKKDR